MFFSSLNHNILSYKIFWECHLDTQKQARNFIHSKLQTGIC